MTDRHAILTRETAHLPQLDRDRIGSTLTTARALLARFPTADEQALTLKLQSFGLCPRWVCVLIARAALEPRTVAPAAVAA